MYMTVAQSKFRKESNHYYVGAFSALSKSEDGIWNRNKLYVCMALEKNQTIWR